MRGYLKMNLAKLTGTAGLFLMAVHCQKLTW